MQEDINDVKLMIDIKIYTKKLYQNVIMYVIFVSKIVSTHTFFVVYISTYITKSNRKSQRNLQNKHRD